MDSNTLNTLQTEGLINEGQHSLLSRIYDRSLFSLHYELKTMLYFGVLLFTSGVGLLVYKNIDTIGHQAIIAALVVLMGICFWYTAAQRPLYSNAEVKSPGTLHEYVLLLGCLLFATIVGYAQYQYAIFGTHWEFSALIPALVFLFVAYAFDHRGVLSLGIAGIASWLGLTVSPVEMLKQDIFSEDRLIITGLAFGAVLCAVALLLDRQGIKKHFTFTSLSLGSHILFISCLAALFTFEADLLFFLLLMACCAGGILYARKEQSFMFLLISCIYGYIGITHVLAGLLREPFSTFLYFIVSCGAIIYFIFNYKRFLARQ
jgi:hypothetical protein